MALTECNLHDERLTEELDDLMRLDCASEAFWRIPLKTGNSFDHRLYGAENAILLLSAAERARNYAKSWRKFKVGAAGFAIYEGGGLPVQYRLIHGANFKPLENDGSINIHAEDILGYRALQARRPGQHVDIAAFAVVGDPQPDQQSGIVTDTLQPCGLCRDSFMKAHSPIGPESFGVTANTEFTSFEWFTIHSLRAYHLGVLTKEEALGAASFAERPLSLAERQPEDFEGQTIDFSKYEEPRYIASNRLVMAALQIPITQYVQAETAFDRRLAYISQTE